jgi:hypothetical protein
MDTWKGDPSKVRISSPFTHAIRVGICSTIFLVMIAGHALSDPVIPYEPGDTQTFQGTAARLVNIRCTNTYDGCIFTFDLEVFASAWRPVYAVRFLKTDDGPISPVDWPTGWSVQMPLALVPSEGTEIVIRTATDPIQPGSQRAGFAISGHAIPLVFKWSPEDENGALIGKSSIECLTCPVSAEPGTWGAIKAMYR